MSDTGVAYVNFGTAPSATAPFVGFVISPGSGTAARQAPTRFAYDDIGEALYQDVLAIVASTPTTVWVLDVFEADELGPEHHARQKPQLWDARVPRAVAL